MIFRIVWESLARRRRRKLLSVFAVSLGIAVTAAVTTLALDVGDKVSRELRSFGANLSVTPAADGLPVAVGGIDYRPAGAGAFLPETVLVSLKRVFWRNNIVSFAPFLFVPATIQGHPVVVIGSWFEKAMPVDKSELFVTGLEKLHPAWKISGQWPADDDAKGALVGRRLAERLNLHPGQIITLVAAGSDTAQRSPAPSRPAEFTIRGILEAGGPEDSQVLASLASVQRWAGLEGKIRRIEISALTKPEDAFAHSDVSRLSAKEFDRWYCTPYVSSIAYQIQQAIPEAQAKPIYHVAETEGRIMNRVGVLMALLVVAALVAAGLAVASMMLATVLERRAEIGLFKALGSTDARVAAVFLLEACAIGVLGGVTGYFFGSLLAWRLALAVFGSAVGVHWVILPLCLGVALLVTLAGSAVPLGRALRISPSLALRD
ncbi:MAG: ABC transporter permease [Terriglobia bacterium]|jgi:putative ABC transport system permease protein